MLKKKPYKSAKAQHGAILFTALVFMIILTMLAITSMSTNTLEEKMAANAVENNISFQAADSITPVAWQDFWSNPDNQSSFTTVNINDFDGNSTDISYSAAHEQEGPPSRCEVTNIEDCNEAGFTAKQYYRVSSTSTTASGLITNIHVGGYRWGPATN